MTTSTSKKELIRRLNEYDKPLWIAAHFGFKPIIAPTLKRVDAETVRECHKHPHYDAVEKASVTRIYLDNVEPTTEHPLTIAYKRSRPRTKENTYSLHYIGSNSGIAEATLIRSALSILAEEGHKNLFVEANSIGDKDSISIYERELNNYIRKVSGYLTEQEREKVSKDIFEILHIQLADNVRAKHVLPTTIAYLTPHSRNHFKEVLEYIEALEVDFGIAPHLMGERNHTSHTIFSIKDPEAEDVLAIGYRYSRMAKYFGQKKEIPMVGIDIFSKFINTEGDKMYHEPSKPKFYLIHLGREAKMKSVSLLEYLRKERIRVHHYLGQDKLSGQLNTEECRLAPYHIILGQKEALDGTATVRNVSTRAQETVSIQDLAKFLKKIPI